MAKGKVSKPKDLATIMRNLTALLDETKEAKTELRTQLRQKKKETATCLNHPNRIVYRGKYCNECDSINRNLQAEARANKEPFISTNGYWYGYTQDGQLSYYHRILAERYLGRSLRNEEKVTFLDGDKSNCVLENLAIQVKISLEKYKETFNLEGL